MDLAHAICFLILLLLLCWYGSIVTIAIGILIVGAAVRPERRPFISVRAR